MLAALGGMIAPAIVFLSFNAGTPTANGWGIPTATDIAFAIGILSLMGDRVPVSLKIFLTALAIADDLGAIVVIALFYGGAVEWGCLLLAVAIMVGVYISKVWRERGRCTTLCRRWSSGDSSTIRGSIPPSRGWRWRCSFR